MRHKLEQIRKNIQAYGTDLEEKDLDLRDILEEMLELIDQALPQEVEPD